MKPSNSNGHSHTPAPFLFSGVEEGEGNYVDTLPLRECSTGEVVIAEGTVNERIYWVEQGEFTVWKGPINDSSGVQVALLKKGDCFGEMSVLQGDPASASLIACEPSTLRELDLHELPEAGGVRAQVTHNLARTLVNRLTSTNKHLEQKHQAELATQLRLLDSLMVVGRIIVTVSIYVFLLPVAAWLKPVLPSDSLISFGFIILLTGVTWTFQKKSSLLPKVFGLTTAQWPRQIWRGVLWTLPWLALALVAKYGWVLLHPDTVQLFEPERAMTSATGIHWGQWALFLGIYCAFSFAQEYVRAVVQGALGFFYHNAGQSGKWRALLIANIVFAILHVHLSPIFAVLAFVAGILWGWIFQREQSYLSAATSHVLIGTWVVFILGVPY